MRTAWLNVIERCASVATYDEALRNEDLSPKDREGLIWWRNKTSDALEYWARMAIAGALLLP